MGILGILKTVFSSGVVGSVERLASEAIQTNGETAEANALWIKTLDPNGIMRRELARFACKAYGFYLISAVVLIALHFLDVGDPVRSKEALTAITDLFLPITASWASIVGASFGVNAANIAKGN